MHALQHRSGLGEPIAAVDHRAHLAGSRSTGAAHRRRSRLPIFARRAKKMLHREETHGYSNAVFGRREDGTGHGRRDRHRLHGGGGAGALPGTRPDSLAQADAVRGGCRCPERSRPRGGRRASPAMSPPKRVSQRLPPRFVSGRTGFISWSTTPALPGERSSRNSRIRPGRRVFDVNVTGLFTLTRDLVPLLEARPGPPIRHGS